MVGPSYRGAAKSVVFEVASTDFKHENAAGPNNRRKVGAWRYTFTTSRPTEYGRLRYASCFTMKLFYSEEALGKQYITRLS